VSGTHLCSSGVLAFSLTTHHLPPLPMLCLYIGMSPVWQQQHIITTLQGLHAQKALVSGCSHCDLANQTAQIRHIRYRSAANIPNRYSALCGRPVTHAQTWASYSTLYRFGKLFSECSCPFIPIVQITDDIGCPISISVWHYCRAALPQHQITEFCSSTLRHGTHMH